MATLVITKTYTAGDPLMEIDVDAYRNGLHDLFNTNLLNGTNFSGSTNLTGAKFSGTHIITSDNYDINFGSGDDAFFGINSSKELYWNTAVNTTEIRFYAGATHYMEFSSTSLNVPGDIIVGEGGASKGLLQIIGQYKKPVLEYNTSSTIRLQQNSGTADTTVIVFPSFIASVTESSPSKFRHASISNTANGYGTSDAGAAQGGRRSGVSATTNSWYYVYAVKVRSGSDYSATTAKFIMVIDSTAPTSETTNNTNYGTGNWVYLGLIRYGFGATGSSSEIIPFKYSNKGTCSFTAKASGGTGYGGLNLAYTTTDADNTASAFYTIASGTSGNVIPSIIGHVKLSLNRERVSDWYIKDTSGDIIWRGGWQSDDGTLPHGHLIELANDTNYGIFQERKSSTAGIAKAVTLAGFTDGMMVVRQMGHGI